jgi:predicted O-methyltransferase YrrM
MTEGDKSRARVTTIVAGAVLLGISAALWLWLGAFSLALTMPIALAILLAGQQRLLERLQAGQRRSRNDVLRQMQALQAIHALLPIKLPLPTMGKYTVDPDFAALLVSTILEHRPRHVLELGSGVSTLIVAYALRAAGGGQVVSIDESEHYRSITQDHLRRHALIDVARVVHAPLVELSVDGQPYRWYDLGRFGELPAVDLLIVDGPSGRTGPLARYPALPLLARHLQPRALILMDDADREDEQRLVAMWRDRFGPLHCERVTTRKGAFVLSREQAGA